jgi:phage terminase large subunit GpA-like protein
MKPATSTTNPFVAGARLGFRPPTRLQPWQWAQKHVKIQNSERSSSFDPEQTPWWKAPMECAADSETRECVIIAPTGSGKSTLAEALVPYVVSEDPGNLLYASQTDPDAKFWAETRLLPTLKSCEPIMGLWPEDRSSSRKLEIIFPHMALVLGGANMSNFQEKSCRWLYGDEVWKWTAGLIREFLARHHNRWNRKVFLVSQGGETGKELDLEWQKTTQANFSWKCEKCKTPQIYSWDSLRFDVVHRADGEIDEQATAETARLECISCRAQYPDTAMVRRKLAGSNMGNGSQGYVGSNPNALTGYAGFHVDSLAIWWVPWSDEVLGWLEGKRMLRAGVVDKYRQWWQKRRANFWSDDMADAKVEISRSDFSTLDHADGKPMEGEAMMGPSDSRRPARFITIDVQGTHFWAIVQAWKAGGGSRILWEGRIAGDGKEETALVDLAKRYNVHPPDVWIDIGYDQPRIFNLMALHLWRGIKGEGNKRSFAHVSQSGAKTERLYSKIQRARSPRGAIVQFVFVATNPVKDILHAIITGHGADMEFPSDMSKDFEKHLKAERREMIRSPKTGQEESVWVTKNRDNHLWDCLVYQIAAALMMRLFESLPISEPDASATPES